MKKLPSLLPLFLLLFAGTVLAGCSSPTEETTSAFEDFLQQLEDKGYAAELEQATDGFLQAPRQRVILDSENTLDVYLYESEEELTTDMESIGSEGFEYDNGSEKMVIDWVAPPHFYQKETMIVQYVGEDEAILSHLEELLGEQFAGVE